MSFLKSVNKKRFSSVPFFISIEPCLTTPDNLKRYPGRVLCSVKKLGVIDWDDSVSLLAWRKVPTVTIRVE